LISYTLKGAIRAAIVCAEDARTTHNFNVRTGVKLRFNFARPRAPAHAINFASVAIQPAAEDEILIT
jgi:hypothetical protein